MPLDQKAVAQWERSQHAYEHYLLYIGAKNNRWALSFADLVFVKNFKGGSATIAEPVQNLPAKLKHYEEALTGFAVKVGNDNSLAAIPDKDYAGARALMVNFAGLPELSDSDINGFGSSFASTLLHFHFPELVPILDKRALNGAGIKGLRVNKSNTVLNLLELYPKLIDECRNRLKRDQNLKLRDLDRTLFIERLRPPFQVR